MSIFNISIFSKKRFNGPIVHFTLDLCSPNISVVISKQRKRDIKAPKMISINSGINPILLELLPARIHHRGENRALKDYRKNWNSPILRHFELFHLLVSYLGPPIMYPSLILPIIPCQIIIISNVLKFIFYTEITFDLHRTNKQYRPPNSTRKRYTDLAGNYLSH